jgi:hypothetical protein
MLIGTLKLHLQKINLEVPYSKSKAENLTVFKLQEREQLLE